MTAVTINEYRRFFFWVSNTGIKLHLANDRNSAEYHFLCLVSGSIRGHAVGKARSWRLLLETKRCHRTAVFRQNGNVFMFCWCRRKSARMSHILQVGCMSCDMYFLQQKTRDCNHWVFGHQGTNVPWILDFIFFLGAKSTLTNSAFQNLIAVS